jgi:S-adenosyl-L-methionine hydrolase (adenosine-forming)
VNTILSVLTDFGLADPYVGIMKAVILSINADVRIIDITHLVEAQDVREAAFLIPEYCQLFPVGSVHLCVVDPTLGSGRKALIVANEGHFFVGPDNGIFTFLIEKDAKVYEITNNAYMRVQVSGTFHGRDVFAPAAAHLSRGVRPEEFGPAVDAPVRLPGLLPSLEGDIMFGEIVRFDRFGNAISNIPYNLLRQFIGESSFRIELKDLTFETIQKSYFESRYTCLTGSSGYLEFGMFKGHLAQHSAIRKGDAVKVKRSAKTS